MVIVRYRNGQSSGVAQQVKDPELVTAVAQVAAVPQVRSLTQEFPHVTSVAKKKEREREKWPYLIYLRVRIDLDSKSSSVTSPVSGFRLVLHLCKP